MPARDFKNIIFDLGGVIINLDEAKTVERLARVSALPAAAIQHHFLHFDAYKQFEKGQVPVGAFREAVRKEFKVKATDEEIDDCMNAMLLDIPGERIRLLGSLRAAHRLFLLSNTNEVHYACFNRILKETTGDVSLGPYFEKSYYSHLVHMRKPDLEVFEKVLSENGLVPADTLFIDDNRANLEGAKPTGISTFHITGPHQLFELFGWG